MSLILGILFYAGLFLIVAGLLGVIATNRLIRDRGRSILQHESRNDNAVMISFRQSDLDRAKVLRDLIRQQDLSVFMWNPLEPFADPGDNTIEMIDRVRVFVYVEPAVQSPWMSAEYDYATASGCPIVTLSVEDSPESVAAEVVAQAANERRFIAPAAESTVLKQAFGRHLKEGEWRRAKSFSRKVAAWSDDDQAGPLVLMFGTIPMCAGIWLLIIWLLLR